MTNLSFADLTTKMSFSIVNSYGVINEFRRNRIFLFKRSSLFFFILKSNALTKLPFHIYHRGPNSEFLRFDVGPTQVYGRRWFLFNVHSEVNHAARPSDLWVLPSSGWIKLNFGGSSKEICLGNTKRRVAGFGGTLSVSDGSVIKAYAGPAGEVQADEAEVLSLLHGLKILCTLPCSSVWIEGDSEPVIKWLKRESDIPWKFTLQFFEIESIMSRLALGRVTHIHKEVNSVAYKLANKGLTKDSTTIWDQLPNL